MTVFALALFPVFPASPATSTSVFIQAKAKPRKLSFFISSFVPAARTGARLLGGRGSYIEFLLLLDGPNDPRHLVC